MKKTLEQLNLFCIGPLKQFEFGSVEFRLFNGLNDLISDGSRIETYINDAQCFGYEIGVTQPKYYLSEKNRDSQLKLLNDRYGVDQFGNNLWGYIPSNIFIDRPEIIQSFGEEIIYGIEYLKRTPEEIVKKADEAAIFYSKNTKKNLTESIK